MIAIDASSFRRYLDGIDAPDVRAVVRAIMTGEAAFPPVVVAELLSDPKLARDALGEVLSIGILDTYEGVWYRAGYLRAGLNRDYGIKAKLPDTLVAQYCLDHRLPLITHDDDFRRHFARVGLRLYLEEV